MSVTWTLYWLGFFGFPLMVWLAGVFASDGRETSGSHIWVHARSHSRVRDATVREVWQRQNPGKSWEKHRERVGLALEAFLTIGLLLLLAGPGAEFFTSSGGGTDPGLLPRFGGPLLGGLSGAVFWSAQSTMGSCESTLLRRLHGTALAATVLAAAGALALTLWQQELPISHHWIWAPAAAAVLLPVLDRFLRRAQERQSAEEGKKLETWAAAVRAVPVLAHPDCLEEPPGLEEALEAVATNLGDPAYDQALGNRAFFELTEAVILDLVEGRSMSVGSPEVYRSRERIAKVVQEVYFYSVSNLPGFEMHPKVRKALRVQG